jgi:hypothetical protein
VTEPDETLVRIDEHLGSGDVGAAIGLLRSHAAGIPVPRIADVLERAATATPGFDDLVAAAQAVVTDPESPEALYELGYACIERGISSIAVPVLSAALDRAPGARPVIDELVSAYEDGYRYADAVAVLEANEPVLRDWPERYLLAFNALMSGDVAKAREVAARLSNPDDDWAYAQRRLSGMLARAEQLGPLDDRALRPWHYVLNASVLATISPYGLDEGMNGRYAFIQDSVEGCASTLARLRAIAPDVSSVALLPDRSSQIIGLAAASLLGVPTRPYESAMDGALIVGYDLSNVDGPVVAALRSRAPGSVLLEHASCWTTPPMVAADFVGFQHQQVAEPWGARLFAPEGGRAGWGEPDTRPAPELAEQIVAATSTANSREAEVAPGDTVEDLVAFVRGLGDAWPSRAPRDRVWSPGPVLSSRFL